MTCQTCELPEKMIVKPYVQVTIEVAAKLIADYFERMGVDRKKLLGRNRERVVVGPRQMAMNYLYHGAKLCHPACLKSIGDMFGGKDHTTVIWAKQQVANYLATEPDYRERYNQFTNAMDQEIANYKPQ